jgi:hypothetical protein
MACTAENRNMAVATPSSVSAVRVRCRTTCLRISGMYFGASIS